MLSRPKSAIKSYNDSKKEKNVRLKTSDSEEDAESFRDKALNGQQEDGRKSRAKSGFKSSNLYSDDDDNKKDKRDSGSRSSTPSTERYRSDDKKNKTTDYSMPSKKIDHFSRPKSRQERSSSSSSSSTEKHSDNQFKKSNLSRHSSSRSNSSSPSFSNNKSTKKKGSSDDDYKSRNDLKKKKKTLLRSDSSSDSSSSESRNHKTKSSPSSESSTQSSNRNKKRHDEDDDDDMTSSSSAPIRVNIGRKPPIDMTSLNKKKQHSNRSSSLEKPNDDSNDSDESDKKKKSHKIKLRLGETFDLENSQESSNEMTDVSPLPSPHKGRDKNKKDRRRSYDDKDHDRLDMSVFYNALTNDLPKKIDAALNNLNNKSNRSSSRGNGSNNSNKNYPDFNNLNTTIDISQTHYGTKLMRLEAENRRLYNKILTNAGGQKEPKYEIEKPIRLTSSALNRQREQQRIERENQLILKRLLQVKPSKYLNKEEQLKDYERNFGFTSMNYSRSNGTTSQQSGFTNSMSNLSAISTKRSTKSSANNSRISSAKSTSKNHFSLMNLDASELLKRTASASRSRPEWSDRW